jgi:Na+/H+ antiporter NhaD/arsenite permease-like protein
LDYTFAIFFPAAMDLLFVAALSVFIVSFLTIVFEVFDKAIAAMAGAVIMIFLGILTFDEAIEAVDFETIGLLMGMMILVDLASSSGVFSWLNVKIARLTRGQPWLIFILFIVVTLLFSAFLDNVTTMLIIVPVVLSLTKGMGLDSKFFLVALIIFSNIGGGLTLIGDPTNIIIGSAAKLSFNDFIKNLIIPISAVVVVLGVLMGTFRWRALKPTTGNLRQLFVSNLLIQKIEIQFGQKALRSSFIAKVLIVLGATILGFIFQPYIGVPVSVMAVTGAIVLLLMTTEHASVHESLAKVEWPTLFFFAGLFMMVAGLEEVGLLELIGNSIIGFSDDYLSLLLMVLWSSAIVSMLLDNIPFVTVMVPIIFQVQPFLPAGVDPNMLWWALSLGAVLGACGTPIGSSANVVSMGVARRNGVNVSFLDYLKISLPLTFVALSIASAYFILII